VVNVLTMAKEGDFKRHLAIFTYDLSGLDSVSKVRIVQALKGRKEGNGLVKHLGGRFLVPGCFVIPIEKSHEVESLFKISKVPYTKEEVLMC
jgi:hypothetical protein